jgi:hypothetical protein
LTFSGGAVSLRISDDGQRIAYTRRNTPDEPVGLSAIHTDGTNDHVVVTGAQVNALYADPDVLYHDINDMRFIPGTHRLLMNTRQVFEGPGLLKNNDVLLADLDTSAFSTLLAAR